MFDGKSFDRDAVHCLAAGRQLVAPRQVVTRARCEDTDVGVACEVFGDVPRVQLGAAVDVGAVPLHNNRELHSSGVFEESSVRIGSDGAATSSSCVIGSGGPASSSKPSSPSLSPSSTPAAASVSVAAAF